jgi:CRP-like cAMP-binding protein
LSLLSPDQLSFLLAHSEVRQAHEGEVIVSPETSLDAHLVLIDGELRVERLWIGADGHEQASVRQVTPQTAEGGAALLTATRGLRATASRASRYLLIDADRVDEILEWSQQVSSVPDEDARIKRRMALVKQVSVFRQLPLESARVAFEQMRPQVAAAGETVIRQGDRGDRYYLIESGEAEVWRTDPLTDANACVAVLGPGDAFGEEALLQEGFRNATVRMLTPGRLLTLDKEAFDALVRPDLVHEVAPDAAQALVQGGRAQWLDCRYDMEYGESRIPGAQLMPLDRLRDAVATLDPSAMYIVYCRSGRRSRAATFLLRERNLRALSLTGGIKAWPYEIDTRPLEQEVTVS